jgi:Fe2+ or Zn2+ uptake regulation protein
VDGAGTARLTRTTTHHDTRKVDRDVDQDLDRRLRAAGLRATAARRAVLGALIELGGHRTAEDVLAAVRAAGRPIARASAFNALRDLVAGGLALFVDVPGAARYEIARPWHHHFVCRSCGAIVDVECTTGAKPCLTPDLPGADVDEATVVLRGRCPACAAEGRRSA